MFIAKERILWVKKNSGTGMTDVSGTPSNNIYPNGMWKGSLQNELTYPNFTVLKHRKTRVFLTINPIPANTIRVIIIVQR